MVRRQESMRRYKKFIRCTARATTSVGGEASEDLDHQESRVNEELVTAIVPFVSEVPLRCEVNISNNFSTLDTDDNVPKMQDELVREAGLVSGRWSDQVETDPVQLPVKRGRGRPKKGEGTSSQARSLPKVQPKSRSVLKMGLPDYDECFFHNDEVDRTGNLWILRALNDIDSRSQWVVGSGNRIDFWRDRWAGTRSIQEAFHLTDRELRGCSSRVSSIIGNGRIYCPSAILELIQKAGLSINDMKRAEEDTLIWLPELKGDFSIASAFEAIRNKGVRVHWHGAVWNRFTHPKLAANAWKLYSGRAATDLAAKKKGIQIKRQNVSYVDCKKRT
ncbi:hypothetical protein IFM89_000154 [Coptis chinensis]|uniref:Uncharacterized protein n=1 Tax=Coptis chinensis TaxID=261450 RepID=A0A835H3H7_9MAGN|nr:hypothetical protein IFM89_000154 [Coptis chinensis]